MTGVQTCALPISRYDLGGRLIEEINANGQSRLMSYDALGQLNKTWQKVTGADGVVASTFTITKYDANQRVIEVIQPGSSNQVTSAFSQTKTETRWNGFGETTEVIINGQQVQFAEYDNAGNVWRSNSGDGVTKAFLYDLEGRNTATITSSARDLKKSFTSSLDVVSRGGSDLIRTETQYDALGHVTATLAPKMGAITKLEAKTVITNVTYSETVQLANRPPNDKNVEYAKDTLYKHKVNLNLPSMSAWGNGDVKVVLSYTRDYAQNEENTKQVTKIVSSQDAAQPLTINWQTEYTAGNDFELEEIRVYKKNAQSEWVAIAVSKPTGDRSAPQNLAWNNLLTVTSPPDLNIKPKFQYRLMPSGQWQSGVMRNFGNSYVFNPMDVTAVAGQPGKSSTDVVALADGQYEYKIEYFKDEQKVSELNVTGQLTVGSVDARLKAAQLYVALFNRAPTAAELKQASEIVSVVGIERCAEMLIASSELASWSADRVIESIYSGALHQTVSSSAKAYYLNLWNNGQPNAHGAMVADLINTVVNYSQSDSAGQSSKKLFLDKTTVALSFAKDMLGEDINAAKIVISKTEISLAEGLAFVRTFATVADANTRIKVAQLYVLLLNRAPDKTGLNYWSADLVKPNTLTDLSSIAGVFYGLSSYAALGDNHTEIIHRVFTQVFGWSNATEEAKWVARMDAAPKTSAGRGKVLFDLMNTVMNDVSGDLEVRAAQTLFTNRVNVGLFYALGLEGEEVSKAININAQVRIDDPYTAIDLARAGAAGGVADNLDLTSLYVLLFNRAPESSGFAYWKGRRNLGESMESIANSMLQVSADAASTTNLVQNIFKNTFDITSVPSAILNQWVTRLNTAGNGGPDASKGQVLLAMAKHFLSYVSPAQVTDAAVDMSSLAVRDLFKLKLASGLTYVSFDGNSVSDATNVMAAVSPDQKAMLAVSQALAAKINFAKATRDLADAEASAAATALAKAMSEFEASAASLAYAKAQALAASGDVKAAALALERAQSDVENASAKKTLAQKKSDDAASLVVAAASDLDRAKVDYQIDQSAAKLAAVNRAQLDWDAAQTAAANALAESEAATRSYNLCATALSNATTDLANKRTIAANAESVLTNANNDYDSKLKAFNDADKVYTSAKNSLTAASNALDAIQNGNATNRTTVYQLYALILNENNPSIAGVNWWMNDLQMGRSPASVAWNMYSAMNPKPATSLQLMQAIFANSLGRTDNDTGGMTYWAGKFDTAIDGDAKGQILVDLLNSVLSFVAPDLATATANELAARETRDRTKGERDAAVDLERNLRPNYELARDNFNALNFSASARQQLVQLYVALQNRPDVNGNYDPATNAMVPQMNQIRTGVSILTLAEQLFSDAKQRLGSNRAVLDFIFTYALGRTDNDTGFFNYYTDQFARGKTGGQVVLDIITAVSNFQATRDLSSAYNTLQAARTTASEAALTLSQKQSTFDSAVQALKTATDNKAKTDAALAKVNSIDSVKRKQVHQLFVFLFNNQTPDVSAVETRVAQLNSGKTLSEVAWSMVADSGINQARVFEYIYTGTLARPQNSAAATYWDSELNILSGAIAKGQKILYVLDAIASYNGSDPEAIWNRDHLNPKVDASLLREQVAANANNTAYSNAVGNKEQAATALESARTANDNAQSRLTSAQTEYDAALLEQIGLQAKATFNAKVTGGTARTLQTVATSYNNIKGPYETAAGAIEGKEQAYANALAAYAIAEQKLREAQLGVQGAQARTTINSKVSNSMALALRNAQDAKARAQTIFDSAELAEKEAIRLRDNAQIALNDAIQNKNSSAQIVARAELEKAQAELDVARENSNKSRLNLASANANSSLQSLSLSRAKALIENSSTALTPANQADLANKLYNYGLAKDAAQVALTQYNNAVVDRTRIQNASNTALKQIEQLYVLIFGKVDPDIPGVSYWLDQLSSGKSLANVATAMYKAAPAISALSAIDLVKRLYEVGLERYDNDTSQSYWVNQISNARDV